MYGKNQYSIWVLDIILTGFHTVEHTGKNPYGAVNMVRRNCMSVGSNGGLGSSSQKGNIEIGDSRQPPVDKSIIATAQN